MALAAEHLKSRVESGGGTSCTSAMHDITRKRICALLEKKKKKKGYELKQ